MNTTTCDRCTAVITGLEYELSVFVDGVQKHPETNSWDICPPCLRKLKQWMKTAPKAKP